jgi:hypothetical protein
MTRNTARIIGSSMLAMGVLLLCALPLLAQDSPQQPTLNHAQAFGVSPRLDELAKLPQPVQYGFHEANPYRRIAKANFGSSVDPAQRSADYPAEFAVGQNLLGVGNGFPGYSVPDAPPDTNMAVGDWPGNEQNAQILQWVNVSYTVCNKTGTCGSAIPGNTLWAAALPGTLCANNNDGDILAQFDRKAHAWVLSQNVFVSPYAVCIAVSKTPDANGAYNVYQFPVPGNGFPDYPKIGIWSSGGASDGYYQAMNNFGPGGSGFMGPQICAYHRANMIAGIAAEQICFQLSSSEDSLLPGDVDSPVSPPTNQCEFYIGSVGDVDNSHLSLYSMCINSWPNGSATVTGLHNSQLLAVQTYSGSCSGSFGGDCVPQLGTTDKVDSLGDRLMYRFAYWNTSSPTVPPCALCGVTYQYWYVNGDVESTTGQIGVRWYELRLPSTSAVTAANLAATTPLQQQTYAGNGQGDTNYRWMGSLTRDFAGDILLGYSLSSSALHPAIGVAGRKASDAPSTLSDEALLCNLGSPTCAYVINNAGSQPDTSNRWGDYSSMRIDPFDNCTFWYTTEYYMVTQRFDWSTQILSAKFPNCH